MVDGDSNVPSLSTVIGDVNHYGPLYVERELVVA
jgi:hypothetical protein